MIIRRRTRSVIILLAIILLLIVIKQWTRLTVPLVGRSGRKVFAWHDVEVRYPVQRLKELPKGQPKRLPKIQYEFSTESAAHRSIRLKRQAVVRRSFIRCWTSYQERAWLKDELAPISGESRNRFGGWGATLVDSLDTLWIMDLKDELSKAINAVATIDITSSTEQYVDIFETTIRYLGGLLSAYDLTNNQILLDKSIEVGEMLLVAFDTPNHMPVSRWDWRRAADGHHQTASENTFAAELGSLTLDFTRLSQITQDPIWYDKIARITELFAAQQLTTNIPGLWPVNVNARDKTLNKDVFFSLGGMSDSFYEYLPKTYALLNGLETLYKTMYKKAMETSTRHIFFRPMTPQNHDILLPGNAYAASQRDTTHDPQVQHLGCFIGGTLAYGSKLFNLPSHLDLAQRLVNGCIWAYNASANGIMPESFHLVPCPSTKGCPWEESKYHAAIKYRHHSAIKSGQSVSQIISDSRLPESFTAIENPSYLLRPETIESIFVLYRVTGDPSLPDIAWKMFDTINSLTETEYGNAELEDVTMTTTPEDGQNLKMRDNMESYWMAETLKYFYLMFSEPHLLSLDEFVFNTEGHPFRRPEGAMR